MNVQKLERIVGSQGEELVPLRDLAKLVRCPQKVILIHAEDSGWNVNVGLMGGQNCMHEFEQIGDYTIEILN